MRVNEIEKVVDDDRMEHTVERNGETIKEEEILTDFLNNKSKKIKQLIK